ncbi:MAG: acyltransferase domain-containing protein [Oscillochloris sp.]|nr:acyltransferase domain-containing protein [Oscillochloris sp.]
MQRPAPGMHRLAIVADSAADLRTKLARSLERLGAPDCSQIKQRNGVYFFGEPLGPQGKLALIFPGEGAQYVDMLADLCRHFPQVRACFDEMDRVFAAEGRSYRLSDAVFPPPRFDAEAQQQAEARLQQMDLAVEALVTANHAMHHLLQSLGVQADGLLGHSTGELSALRAAGMLRLDAFAGRAQELNRIHQRLAAEGRIPAARLLAIGAGREQVEQLRAEINGEVFVAIDNCPHQVILAVAPEQAEQVAAAARKRGLFCEILAFDRAYHTPLYESYAEAMRATIAEWIAAPPQLPLYSCVSAARFPADLAAVRELAHTHWMRPVEFRRTIETMYADGFRIFVEAGPRGNLCAFIDDTLRGRPVLAVPADLQSRSGTRQLNHLLALLAAHHVDLNFAPLYERRNPVALDRADPPPARPARAIRLSTGWPPMQLDPTQAADLRHRDTHPAPQTLPPGSNGHPAHAENAVLRSNNHAEHLMNGSQSLTNPTDTATVQATPLAPPEPVVGRQNGYALHESVPPGDPGRTQVMLAYLQTMEQFLAVQQEVMQAFLHGASGAVPVAQPAPQLFQRLPAPLPQPAPPVITTPPPAVPITPAPVQFTPPPPAEPAQPPPAVAVGAATPLDRAATERLLLQITAEKTGYPIEMLDQNLDIEADLGIDSIKRIEILGAFQESSGRTLEAQMEALSACRRISELITVLSTPASAPEPPAPTPQPGMLGTPLLGKAEALRQDQALRAELTLSLETFPFLRDHTLGRLASGDSQLTGLPVMPLTMSMEVLAEAAAQLLPASRLVGMREVRTRRWIACDEAAKLLVSASITGPQTVHAAIQLADGAGPPIVEGTMLFAADYPPAPLAPPFSLPDRQESRWAPEQLYREAMFHGPAFQGVQQIHAVGRAGASATITTLAPQGLYRNPGATLTDPVLLDQPGQVVGFWAAQTLAHGQLVFPFRLGALRLFGPPPPAGTRFDCRAQIALDGPVVRSQLSLVDADGRIYAAFEDWEDRRFDLPPVFRNLILAPESGTLSREWPISADATVRRLSLSDFPPGLLSDHGEIWLRVLAWLMLGRNERMRWQELRTPFQRRAEWLLARVAAKEALRERLADSYGLHVHQADIEITSTEHGAPQFAGPWLEQLPQPPQLSLSHSGGVAAALVSVDPELGGVGIDIQSQGKLSAASAQLAFSPAELALLAALPDDEPWPLRLWCAKEALAKAYGTGLRGGPQAISCDAIEPASGIIRFGAHTIAVQTAIDAGLAYAYALLEKEPAEHIRTISA